MERYSNILPRYEASWRGVSRPGGYIWTPVPWEAARDRLVGDLRGNLDPWSGAHRAAYEQALAAIEAAPEPGPEVRGCRWVLPWHLLQLTRTSGRVGYFLTWGYGVKSPRNGVFVRDDGSILDVLPVPGPTTVMTVCLECQAIGYRETTAPDMAGSWQRVLSRSHLTSIAVFGSRRATGIR
jgi:hypothetical protein